MARPNLLDKVLSAGRRQFRTLFVLSFLSNLLLLASSIYMLQVFDRVLSSGSIDTLLWLSVITIGAIVTYGLLEHARRRILSRTGTWISSELSGEVLRRAMSARLKTGTTPAGLGDVADLKAFAGGDAILAFLDAPWSPLFIAIIWLMHPVLGMIALGGAIVLFLLGVLNDVFTRKSQAAVAQEMRLTRRAAETYLQSADTLAGLGMAEQATARWHERNNATERDGANVGELGQVFFNLTRTIRLGLQIAILGMGAALVLRAELTAGGMIAASIILARALSPVERSISAWKSFVSYLSARKRLVRLFQSIPDAKDRISLPRPEGRLTVEELRYFAPDTGTPVIKSVSFRLAPGETCGVLGPSVSGKSKLCKVLVGALPPSFGDLRLDGAEIAEWDAAERGKYVGYLPQTSVLFDGTVAENIARMGKPDKSEVIRAAKEAGAHEMILALPQGYETEVGIYGDILSGGQKQRIGLARALYGQPSLIVLDEPNSNLDGMGEIALQNALESMKARKATVVIVSHVPNILRRADKVLVVQDGTMIRFGPRDEVMQQMMKAGRKVQSLNDIRTAAAE